MVESRVKTSSSVTIMFIVLGKGALMELIEELFKWKFRGFMFWWFGILRFIQLLSILKILWLTFIGASLLKSSLFS